MQRRQLFDKRPVLGFIFGGRSCTKHLLRINRLISRMRVDPPLSGLDVRSRMGPSIARRRSDIESASRGASPEPGSCCKQSLQRPRNCHVPSCRPSQRSVVMPRHAVVSCGFGGGAEPLQRISLSARGAGRTTNQSYWLPESGIAPTVWLCHMMRLHPCRVQIHARCNAVAPVRRPVHPSPPGHTARNLFISNPCLFLSIK